jgi:hypothetical protein
MAKKSEQKFSVKREGKYLKFYCPCGSEMWDNRKTKKSPKHPDLKCKDKECPAGEGGFPYGVWLSKEQKEKLESAQASAPKSGGGSAQTQSSQNYSGDRFNGSVPFSMYAAWAKDIAIYLATATNVTAHDDFDALYRTCLANMKETLEWFQTKNEKSDVKNIEDDELTTSDEEQEITDDVKDVDTEDDFNMDVGEPEDVSEESIKDLSEDEEDFDGLNIDL